MDGKVWLQLGSLQGKTSGTVSSPVDSSPSLAMGVTGERTGLDLVLRVLRVDFVAVTLGGALGRVPVLRVLQAGGGPRGADSGGEVGLAPTHRLPHAR